MGVGEIGVVGKNEAVESDLRSFKLYCFVVSGIIVFIFSGCLFGPLHPPYKKEAAGEIDGGLFKPGLRFQVLGFEAAEEALPLHPAPVRLHRLTFREQRGSPGIPMRLRSLVRNVARLGLVFAFAERRGPLGLAFQKQRNCFVPRLAQSPRASTPSFQLLYGWAHVWTPEGNLAL